MSGRRLLAALLVLAPATLAAQGKQIPDSLVLAHEFTSPRLEFARVWLEEGKVYRIEVTNAQVLEVRSLAAGIQLPLTRKVEDMVRPSNTVAFEIAPSVTALYELRVNGLLKGAAPVQVYEDGNATKRFRALRAS